VLDFTLGEFAFVPKNDAPFMKHLWYDKEELLRVPLKEVDCSDRQGHYWIPFPNVLPNELH